MEGNISKIVEKQINGWENCSRTYGFIKPRENGNDYFFHKSELLNCNIYDLEEGDCVDFEPQDHDGRPQAVKIRKKYSSVGDDIEYNVSPGIHPNVQVNVFNDDELKIIDVLKQSFYITNGGDSIEVGNSEYRYLLIKPTNFFHVKFNLTREIPVIFSAYIFFEPRSLDAAAAVASRIKYKLRLDRTCQILISSDSNIEEKLSVILRDSNLESIVVPFSYREFISGDMNESGIQDRFCEYLYNAELFSNSEPIQNDVFFFGRRDYAMDLANKCKQALNCGIFGLRRSGKTSMLYAVKRILENEGYTVTFIPCQLELESLNWKAALCQIVNDIKRDFSDSIVNSLADKLHREDDYKNKANICFAEDLNILLQNCQLPVVLMFDEIESITFGVSSSGKLWRDGDSYKMFWDCIRGYRSKYPSQLSLVLAGTNPMVNEKPIIKDNIENPMYGQLAKTNQGAYLLPFDIESTKTMINTLGGYMGIKFDDSIAARLTEDCGGHPYLTRLLCAHINQYIRIHEYNRPIVVSKPIYDSAREEFEKSEEAEGFYLMILNILQSCYEKEYNALKILATDGDGELSQICDRASLSHLIGYGLVIENEGHFAIRYDTIRRFLQGKYEFVRKKNSIKEQKDEISHRFNQAEQTLRDIVRDTLRSQLGTEKARQTFLNAMHDRKDVSRAKDLEYKNLFNPNRNKGCYFTVLISVIKNNYELFEKIFETDRDEFISDLYILNRARQIPAHSAPDDAEGWTVQDFEKFRESISRLEVILNNYK